nr:MAG: ORF4 [Torque teno polar bear virus 36]
MTGRMMNGTPFPQKRKTGGRTPPNPPPLIMKQYMTCYKNLKNVVNKIKELVVTFNCLWFCGRQFKLAHKYSVGPMGVPTRDSGAGTIIYISKYTDEWLSLLRGHGREQSVRR